MARDEVDTLLRVVFLMPVNRGTAEKAVREARDGIVVAAIEGANVVAKPSVPFLPTVANETAHLIQPGGNPRFRNELRAGQRRVRLDIPEDWRIRYHLARRIPRQDGGEIEPDTIHVHLADPITEAVENHTADDRMICVERVAGTAVVRKTRAILLQHV